MGAGNGNGRFENVRRGALDLRGNYRTSKLHLLQEHDLSARWEPGEAFEWFLNRLERLHENAHADSPEPVGHVHLPTLGNNGCPECAGFGWVVGFGVSGRPQAMPCFECAALAITPASADDDELFPPPGAGELLGPVEEANLSG